jgi:hypothetical protein
VVSGRHRHDARLPLLRRERAEPGEDAARLERAGALEELGLQEHRQTRELAQALRRECGRTEDPLAEVARSALDVVGRRRGRAGH